MSEYTEKLFSYGTLQLESVQMVNFGRKLVGNSDKLTGHKIIDVTIKDPKVLEESGTAVHPGLVFTGDPADEVSGSVFDITPEELEQADKYEVSDYKRVSVTLESCVSAWIYIVIDT
jgi:gamma-glutamylcyclotransferase (GGCT)/AIG2-like uncharacterized protein YtfP